ncbi:MAG: hypothetical protein AMJ81_04195 [Phycisphaerae bacterium SM23_33]|jgi:hypothetical protein|nr:MAG: hypothetical protein AMJ81_04195 [Phycisphaerae bacterium SM23_33]
MTVRAVMLGLLAALALCGVGYLNDRVLLLENITAGALLPISVFGVLFVLAMAANPLLYRLGRNLRFRPAELAVIVTLMLVACSIVSGGMMDHFTPTLMMPAYYQEMRPGWKAIGLVDYAPPRLLACGGQYDQEIVQGFLLGWGRPRAPIGLGDVPWAQWRGPLSTWLPLAVLMAVAATCMAVIVHPQWSRREHLRYPIAEMASSLMAQDPDKATGTIFRKKIFWIGLAIILTIRTINGLAGYYPSVPRIPLVVNLLPFRELWRAPWAMERGHWLLLPELFPSVVAFSFFLSSEITLSLGLCQWILVPIGGMLIAHGVDLYTGYMSGGVMGWQRFGSYLAFALMILYVGRRYYWLLLKQALTFRPHTEVENSAAWSCRIGLLAMAAVVVILLANGLDWPMAVLTVALMLMTLLCVSRITAETGLFMIHPRWQPLGVLLGLFGYYALGPDTIVIVGLACAVLTLDQGKTLMPYLINALKICDDSGVRPKRVGPAAVATYAMGVVLAVTVALWANYNFGVRQDDFTTYRVPTMPFRAAETAIQHLAVRGQLEAAERMGPVESLKHIRADSTFLWSAGVGFGLVLIVSALRQRLPRWPLHPVMFLIWGTYPAAHFNNSFLLGWFLRTLVLRFAGYSALKRARPFMIGVIAGDLLGGAIFMAAGAIFFALTGEEPPRLEIFP